MAFEVTQQEILKQAIELKQLYETTRIQKYKDEELRLRRIVVELQSISLAAGVTSFNTRTGAVTLTSADVTGALGYTPGVGEMLKSVYDTDNDGIVDNAEGISVVGRNSTGSTLYRGTIVYISGSTGNRPNFVKAQANVEATSAGTFGVVRDDIANNSDGYVTTIGVLNNLDTRSTATNPFTDVTLADGDTVYLHPTIAGYITNVKPSAPNHLVYVGKVTRTHPTLGTIVYRIQNGYELDEIHDVAISSKANNDLLVYESSSNLWKNKTISTIFGGTPLVSVPTLNQVTTAGNVTTNAITVGDITFNNLKSPFSPYGNLITVQSNGGGRLYFNNINAWGLNGFSFGGIDANFGNGQTITFATNSTERMRINPTTGNVGIGTATDAGYKLDVNGTARVSSTAANVATIVGTNTTARVVINNNTTTPNVGVLLQSNSVNKWSFATYGASSDFTFYNEAINADGIFIKGTTNNVGIGTTTPSEKLEVNGNIKATSFIKSGGTSSQFLKADGSVDSSTYLTSQPWTISGSNIYYNTGNVGIGTASPSYKLDVSGTFRATGGIRAYNSLTSDFYADAIDSYTRVYLNGRQSLDGTSGLNNANFYSESGDLTLYINRPSGNQIQFREANSPQVTIDAGGSVGIGTTGPSAKLEIVGSSYYQLQVTSSSSSSGIRFVPSAGNTYELQATNGNEFILYNRTNLAYNLMVKSNGNVLVGTTTDSGYKLDINGTSIHRGDTQVISGKLNVGLDASSAIPSILTNLQVMTPGSMGVYPTLGTAGGGFFVAGDITNYGYFIGVNNVSGNTWMQAMRTDTAQAYHILMQTAGGNVGIGSSGTPSYKLNVTGEINATVAYRINGTQGFTGTYTVATNPVGQRNLNISGGIITSIS